MRVESDAVIADMRDIASLRDDYKVDKQIQRGPHITCQPHRRSGPRKDLGKQQRAVTMINMLWGKTR